MATRKPKISRMIINCHAQLFHEFYLISGHYMVTPASNKIQYHQIIKQIWHANITMYIFIHSVHWFYYYYWQTRILSGHYTSHLHLDTHTILRT